MKSYKKFKDKLDACEKSTTDEKYEFMLSLLPNMKYYDEIKALIEVLDLTPKRCILEDLVKSGYAFYYGVIRSPYCATSRANVAGILMKIRTVPNGSIELLIDDKTIPQFFSEYEDADRRAKEDPEMLSKEYKKMKRQMREATDFITNLQHRLETKEDIIHSQKEHIKFLKENLPERGGEASK